MIFDDVRNRAYRQALAGVVDTESVVLDLGAGLGIHGLMAAQLGARQVFLVEPENIIHVAQQASDLNDLSDNIRCLKQSIETLELDQQMDIICSVFTGNFLLTEDLLPLLFLARDRFLKPGGQLIPQAANMLLAPINARDYYDRHIDAWSAPAQTIDYACVKDFAANSVYYDDFTEQSIDLLSAPALLKQFDFHSATSADVDAEISVTIEHAGLCHGLLGWFDIELGDQWLSTAPDAEKTHWSQVFFPLHPAIEVKAGDTILIRLQRPPYGDWRWTISAGEQRQKRSSLLANPLPLSALRGLSDQHRPVLNDKGQALQYLLDGLNGDRTIAELSKDLRARYPQCFFSDQDSEQFVRSVTAKCSQQ